jgi:SSS family solute:Na+ symporter
MAILNGWLRLHLFCLHCFLFRFYLNRKWPRCLIFWRRDITGPAGTWLAIVSVVSAIIIHIAFSFLAGGIVLKTLFGVNMYVSVIVIAVLTGVYTIIGGLRAVVITESIQTIVLLTGAVIITVICFQKVGGWDSLTATLQQTNSLDKLSMLRGSGDESGMPWYAVFLGYPVLGIWYWCADQTIVQRVLGCKR